MPSPPSQPPDAALSTASLRREFRGAFEPRPLVYWCDLLVSSSIGWTGFFVAYHAAGPMLSIGAGLVALLALYRSVLFIHELAHLKHGALPGFELAWHLLVGLPMLAPSLLYVGSHGDHHRKSVYGTAGDPEYETLADWSAMRLVLSTLGLVLVPAALLLRWSVLGPISWFFPPLRRFLVGRLSTLVINAAYRRRAPLGRQRRRWLWGELGAALVSWSLLGSIAVGVVSVDLLIQWYGILSAILLLNHVRTLAAHRYQSGGAPQDRVGELLDTLNLVEPVVPMTLLAPVGLRFHALHHYAPTLPYHSLGRVHRALREKLPVGSPYHRAEARGLGRALAELVGEQAQVRPKAA